ncbi:YaaR family protein [Aquibacillus albus]|uniref:Uncharacterized protein YaaR (DUF327 family) n=1 Tax=Aquibacillus albus TaxID=1168171 RepID=A0ABS2N4Z9_9BACI|nr:YaaR family protein [Aquibacillus albus]MBM7573128.1 uncharacterized protein YaaR (DUF327 family) [Aquibacillus albus]
MKINQELRSQMDIAQKRQLFPKSPLSSFDSVMASHTQKMKGQALEQLLQQISVQGEKVVRHRSFKDLARYKRMVKGFVEEAVKHGMNLKHGHSWNMERNNRKLTIVEQIDQRLLELTDLLLNQEKKSITVLDTIGEIKGLLINLYT